MRWAHFSWLLAVLPIACQRKAPGPDECRQFAYDALGVQRAEQLRSPDVRERIDTLTTRCLTTPYDRELVQCVARTGRARACTLSFEVRRQR
jgi:hypothetical protein